MSSASMNSAKLDCIQEYKECAGKGCKNIGVHYLKVAFLNQFGWFCEGCKKGLIGDNLIEAEQENNKKSTDCVSFTRPSQPVETVGVTK